MTSSDPDIAASFNAELAPSEKILWAGRPKSGTVDWTRAWPSALMLSLFAVVVALFLWILSNEEPGPGNLPSLLIAAVTGVILLSLGIKDALLFFAPMGERYALTSQRVLMRSGRIRSRVHHRPLPTELGTFHKRNCLDFGAIHPEYKRRGEPIHFRFLGLENADEVKALFHSQIDRIKAP